jgi:hypothetical protein
MGNNSNLSSSKCSTTSRCTSDSLLTKLDSIYLHLIQGKYIQVTTDKSLSLSHEVNFNNNSQMQPLSYGLFPLFH